MSKETAKNDAKDSQQSKPLQWEVFETPAIPVAMADKPAGAKETYFQTMASTLIYGEKDAILVDTFMTVEQASALADWVASKHKNLTTIYITHGHGDHWFGAATILERFPGARLVATPSTIAVMQYNSSPQGLAAWGAAFPGQIPRKLATAEALQGNTLDLEGREVDVVELGHTDTDHTTCLHVPSIGLVVGGDAVYNDVHLYFVESTTPEKRQEWIAALDKIDSLHPRVVIASHKRPGNDDSPRIIEETRKYVRDFDRLAASTKSAQELYDKMLELYPNRVNPTWALWSSARAAKP